MEPNPIPIDYVTNAGLIWKSGELYHYDGSHTPPFVAGAPKAWPAASSWGDSGKRDQAMLDLLDGSAVSHFSAPDYVPGQRVTVTINVTPDASTQVYAAEDAPPDGWAVSEIDNAGSFDSVNRKVKWGPFFDASIRSLSYSVTPPMAATGTGAFSGVASFDGLNIAVTGARSLAPHGPSHAYAYWVPAVMHGPGARGTEWRADVSVLNRGTAATAIELSLITSSHTLPGSFPGSLVTGAQALLRDVVGELGSNVSGHLKIEADQPLVISARIYNQSPDGTFGQGMNGYTSAEGLSSGDEAFLPQLIEDADFRTNIGFANMGDSDAALRVTLYQPDGTALGSYDISVSAGHWTQDNAPFQARLGEQNVVGGYARVKVVSGSGILAYASVVDNATGDPTTITMRR